jgi:hypothetical protein
MSISLWQVYTKSEFWLQIWLHSFILSFTSRFFNGWIRNKKARSHQNKWNHFMKGLAKTVPSSWGITLCSPLKVNRRFGGTYRLHLQGRRISRARNQRKIRWQAALVAIYFHSGFLVGLFFDPEDGGDMFIRNGSWLSTDYKSLYPRREDCS